MFPRPIEQAPKHRRLIYQVMLPVSLFIWLVPLLAIFMTSIRSAKDINTGNVFGWPTSFEMFENYTGVFLRSNAGQYFLNSIWITLPTVAVSISLACLAGYALAIYRFRWSVPLFFLFIAGNFVPFQILMVPVRDLSVQTGLYNTVTGLVLFHAAFQTGFCTLFMRNFIRALPFELIESARIDGANHIQIFIRLIVPLSVPALASFSIFQFLWVWNDLIVALYIGPNEGTDLVFPIRLEKQLGTFKDQLHLLNASAVISMIVPVIVFLAMQRYFIRGLLAGSVKGG